MREDFHPQDLRSIGPVIARSNGIVPISIDSIYLRKVYTIYAISAHLSLLLELVSFPDHIVINL